MEWWVFDMVKIVLINLVLSGDNAVVIAMASRNLPSSLQRLAIFWGAVGAIVLRVILTIVAFKLLSIPFLMAAGALLLLWVAVDLLVDRQSMDHKEIKAPNLLLNVVMIIMLADFIMSLDNVIAIAAVAQGNLLLIVLGLLFSIPVIIWGSHFILKLLERYPLFLYLGSSILAYTAGEMILNDPKVSPWITGLWPFPDALIPAILALLVIGVGYVSKRSKIYC
jgi:YjbE family integral membrane protein